MAKYSKAKLFRNIDTCIFCGVKAKLSGEHFWPKWASKALGIPLAGGPHREWLLSGPGKLPLRTEMHIERHGHVMRKKIYAVCSRCNNNWMNDLEKAMIRFRVQLVRGESVELSVSEQADLARWVLMKVMVGEHNAPKEAAFTQELRKAFMMSLSFPENLSVYIATCGVDPWNNAFLKNAVTLSLTPDPPEDMRLSKNSQTTAFGLGSLFVFTMFSRSPGVNLENFLNIQPPFVRIWPAGNEPVRWPFIIIPKLVADGVAMAMDALSKHPRTLWRQ